jgi:glycosyltransferase involved in cell wall biosynthesis
MRILKIAHSYLPERTGISEVARQLAEGLAGQGHEVHVATSSVTGRPQTTVINGVQVHSFDLRGNWLQGVSGSQAEQIRYRTFVCEGNWDVRHFHAGQVWTLDLLLDDLRGLPGLKFYTPHGLPGLNLPEWQPYYAQMRTLFPQFDRVISLSETFDDKPFCTSLGLETVVIPNGVDLTEFAALPQKVRPRWVSGARPMVLNVSNHSPNKGHTRLIDLARALPETAVIGIGNHYPAEKWNLGRFGIKGGCFYRCMAAPRRVPNLQWHQHVPRDQIVSALQEADLFVLTSIREAAPLVILEAMAAGLPWVSFDVGNVRENVGGLVVNSTEELIAAVEQLLNHPQQRRELGAAGRQQIQAGHSWAKIVERHVKLYQSEGRETQP